MPSKPEMIPITVPAAEKDGHALSKELDYFLRIDDSDVQLLARYRDVLAQDNACFSQIYYDYLFASRPPPKRFTVTSVKVVISAVWSASNCIICCRW